MEAREASLKDIVEREPHRLEVPFFQRKYVWKEENWREQYHSNSDREAMELLGLSQTGNNRIYAYTIKKG